MVRFEKGCLFAPRAGLTPTRPHSDLLRPIPSCVVISSLPNPLPICFFFRLFWFHFLSVRAAKITG